MGGLLGGASGGVDLSGISGATDSSGGSNGLISPSSLLDAAPAQAVGDPFTDPFFGSEALGNQQGPTGGTYPNFGQNQTDGQDTSQGQPQQGQQPQQPQQQQPQNMLKQAATELQKVSKVLGGPQNPQTAAWIQPQNPNQPQAPNQQSPMQAIHDAIVGTQNRQQPQGGGQAAIPQPQPQQPPAPKVQATPTSTQEGGGQSTSAAPSQPQAQTPQSAQQASLTTGAPTASPGVTSPSQGFLYSNTLQDAARQIHSVPINPLSDPLYATAATPETASGTTPSPSPQGAVPEQLNARNYIRSVFQIESGFNPNERTGSKMGLGQFGPDEERMYGINDSNRNDPRAQANALQREYIHHKGILQRALARDPEPWESYFTHQQGPAGGPALLTADPNRLAWTVLRKFYKTNDRAISAISGNVLDHHWLKSVPPESITAGQFREMWRDRFNRSYNQQQGQATPQPRSNLLSWIAQRGAA